MELNISISNGPSMLGKAAAARIAMLLDQAVREKGAARILLSTGASQFETISALLESQVDWSKVEMFHLDEYVGLPKSHPASFRNYLKERFTSNISLKAAHFINAEGDVAECIASLTGVLRAAPVDVGVIGIGENAHIAFNDPPADFDREDAFCLVALDRECKEQQVGEGWFASIGDVPSQAVTMTVKQIMACKHIVSAVPHSVKAEAVKNTLTSPVTPAIPATILKTHPGWHLYLDRASASGLFQL